MNRKNLIIAFLAGVAVIGVAWGLSPSSTSVVEKTVERLGGTNPDVISQYLNVGGVRHEYRRAALNTATTTPCALQSPAATSTLLHSALRIEVGTSTATVWTVAKAANAFATTTAFDQFSLGSGAQGTMFVGSASSTAPDEISVIAPSQYVVWGVQGTTIANSALLTGYCQAEFIVI